MTGRRPFILAIDGPAGAGKSSAAKALAARLGFSLVDTGAIYRCVALKARREGVAWEDDPGLGAILERVDIRFESAGSKIRVLLDGADVSREIRTQEISSGASAVSGRPVVRAGLLELQRRLALEAERGVVLEGRDIGTVVFPDADLKVFLDARPEVRAQRRRDELAAKGVDLAVEKVLSEQNARDRADSTRELAPLRAAADAVVLDSSELSLSEVVARVASRVEEALRRRA